MTTETTEDYLASLSDVFDVVRVVEPAVCGVVPRGAVSADCEGACCYCFFGKKKRCADCTSSRVNPECPTLSKLELVDGQLYYFVSRYVEIEGHPLALELISKVAEDAVSFPSDGDQMVTMSLGTIDRQLNQDTVSGARSRRFWDDLASRREGLYGVAVLDMDNFKAVNDRLGHPWGDRALRLVATKVMRGIRDSDDLIRYGGDEFILLLSNVKRDAFRERLQWVRDEIASITVGDHDEIRLSASIGGVQGLGKVDEMFRQADDLLLQAKTQKHCVVVDCGRHDRDDAI